MLPVLVAILSSAVILSAPSAEAISPSDTTDAASVVLGGPAISSGIALSRWTPANAQDTVRKARPKAVVYSDAYSKRLAIHKTLSWAMLPLFAASYVSGDQLLKNRADAPEWARTLHQPAAMGTAALFGINTVTGAWNLWEGRADPNGRTRRIVHSVLFTAASAGFAYTGTRLADDAGRSADARTRHRSMAIGSMGISTASWLLMLIGN